ncbi:MAG TPA: YggS family pyridoxal phosphate-dependent enzyme [Opitutaceae bacterium]|nr:YggS family pyridoxal phosphate-dependent enzyme [Opitutaceae bacterium]
MFVSYETFRERADAVRAQIASVCAQVGREPRGVTLLAVTKTHPPAAAEYAARYGLPAVGESRVQEGVEKKARCPAAIRWELIGHLQSNKARLAATHFDRIQSVDSPKLAELLDRAAGELGRRLPVLLQVNAGEDPGKFGAAPADAPRLLEAALGRAHLQVDGLMTIAPLADDPDVARRCFARLRTERDRLAAQFGVPLPELSMGMTADLEPAVAEGSTLVRVGTALFGPRE